MREAIRYLSRGRLVELRDVAPTEMLLDHLRLRLGRTGTKEGCGEGDCGACTVALGRLEDGRMVYEPICACIRPTATIDGCELVTIEDLAAEGALHPIQEALVRHHGAQCGFCTPGIVMSLFTLWANEGEVDREAVLDRLAGNLCRCTGYRPIVDAALEACDARADARPPVPFAARAGASAEALAALAADDDDLFLGDETRFFAAPRRMETLLALAGAFPDATLLAGATDVGLWVTKQGRDLARVIHLGRVEGLDAIEEDGDAITLGATVSLERAGHALGRLDPDVAEVFRRIGGAQVRASGTIGGNIANGSPIGDTPPMLIALDASLELVGGDRVRHVALEDFFLDYGRQDRAPGEILTRIRVPRLGPGQAFRAYKIAKRHDQDISTLLAAIRLTIADRRIVEARIAFGGMAGTPRRALGAEAALVGASLDEAASWRAALEDLRADFTPLSDLRGAADYRTEVSVALLGKALAEIAGTESGKTRIRPRREEAGR
ncbi:MAG: xanthine dehydrogenase small subunit [Hyphomicrobiales bacterium]|nr:xanthine dehydrogenase small subunit [Hyphomicrobiales bacterium]